MCVGWPQIAVTSVICVAESFLGMEAVTNDFASGFLNELRAEYFLGQPHPHAKKTAEHALQACAFGQVHEFQSAQMCLTIGQVSKAIYSLEVIDQMSRSGRINPGEAMRSSVWLTIIKVL